MRFISVANCNLDACVAACFWTAAGDTAVGWCSGPREWVGWHSGPEWGRAKCFRGGRGWDMAPLTCQMVNPSRESLSLLRFVPPEELAQVRGDPLVVEGLTV